MLVLSLSLLCAAAYSRRCVPRLMAMLSPPPRRRTSRPRRRQPLLHTTVVGRMRASGINACTCLLPGSPAAWVEPRLTSLCVDRLVTGGTRLLRRQRAVPTQAGILILQKYSTRSKRRLLVRQTTHSACRTVLLLFSSARYRETRPPRERRMCTWQVPRVVLHKASDARGNLSKRMALF